MNTAIFKKLGIEKFEHKAILELPEEVNDFEGLEFDTQLKRKQYDLILSFVFTLEELQWQLQKAVQEHRLKDQGVLYFAYPKKGNKQYDTFIHRDEILPSIEMDADGYVYGSTIKFNKMVALNEVFTIVRLKKTAVRGQRSSQPSQCVADYIDRVPELDTLLQDYPEALELFRTLTPGYQRGWARYVFGVKTQATSQKRLHQMIEILLQGFKSIELYRQAQK